MWSGLTALLDSIKIPEQTPIDRPQYHVKRIPKVENHWFGRAQSGAPCLLLRTKDGLLKAPMRLASIEVSFAIPCNISITGGEQRTEKLTAIVCTASDRVVQEYFAHVCETILQIVGGFPSLEEVDEAVLRLVDLFQKLSGPPRRSIIGLFGELYVIFVANSPAAAVEAWRSAADDRFDFSVDDVRLEVKASGTRQRAHEFSMEQCSPPANTDGVLISLFVETSGGGMSLRDLIERIERKLDGNADLLLKLQETVAGGLGDDVSVALSIRFDERLTRSSLRVYTLESVPAVRGQLPATVSRVRFRSDLSYVPVADTRALASRNKKLKELLPKKS